MNPSLGRITARLAEPTEKAPDHLIDLLNENINPPSPLTDDDVYIRAMYIVSDEVNSYGGRFPIEEHARMAELLVDSPVMVGHRKDKLPVGRNFHAVLIDRDGKNWIKSYFYWLRDADGAASLRDNIDGGIYKECSVGFTFRLPECSICGKDIRLCSHEPFQTYAGKHGAESCYFNYREIERVLETSLVYRGATPYTSVSRDLVTEIPEDSLGSHFPVVLVNLDELDRDSTYLLVPRYDSIALTVHAEQGRISLIGRDGRRMAEDIVSRFDLPEMTGDFSVQARMVGYRGKERCSVSELSTFLENGGGPVSRVVLKLFPVRNLDINFATNSKSAFDVRMIPSRRVKGGDLERSAREIATQLGVEIWPAGSSDALAQGYCYRPPAISECRPGYALCLADAHAVSTLTITNKDRAFTFQISQFDRDLLDSGRRFVADLLAGGVDQVKSQFATLQGNLIRVKEREHGYVIRLDGDFGGTYVFRPILLNGRARFLFYKIDANNILSGGNGN